jgi:protein-tyrosine phosphatase
VCSAGIDALVGAPADSLAAQLMRERGIDISEHRARQLASWMVREADLILTMDYDQKRYLERIYPAMKAKVRRLGEHGNYDVPDPYQLGMRAFRHCFDLIADGVDELAGSISHADQEENSACYGLRAKREASFYLPP